MGVCLDKLYQLRPPVMIVNLHDYSQRQKPKSNVFDEINKENHSICFSKNFKSSTSYIFNSKDIMSMSELQTGRNSMLESDKIQTCCSYKELD